MMFSPANPRLPEKRAPTKWRRRVVMKAQQGGEGERESSVDDDENMIVLRMRIKKMKVIEGKKMKVREGDDDDVAATEWKEWERRVFTHYHEGVCESVEMLQSYLMNTRPSVALGVLALIAISLPFSSSVVLANALNLAKALLAGSHVCIDIDF